MSSKKRGFLLIGIGLISGVVLVACFWLLFGERIAEKFLPDNPWPSLRPTGSADLALVQQFEDLINRADEVNGKAATTFDMTDFPLLYVDDPAVPLSRDQAKYFKEIKANQNGLNNLIKGEGWLSYEQAAILNMGSGARAYQVQATLAAQGRTMSADDYRRVGAPVPAPGVTPTPLPMMQVYGDPNGYKFKVSFKSVTVETTRAEVTYIYSDDGKTTHTFLVNTAAGWRIAGSRRLPS